MKDDFREGKFSENFRDRKPEFQRKINHAQKENYLGKESMQLTPQNLHLCIKYTHVTEPQTG